jgi:hypothetical protein
MENKKQNKITFDQFCESQIQKTKDYNIVEQTRIAFDVLAAKLLKLSITYEIDSPEYKMAEKMRTDLLDISESFTTHFVKYHSSLYKNQ